MPNQPTNKRGAAESVRLLIAEDHQSIIDGYSYRLTGTGVTIVATARFGEQIEPLLAAHAADVIILDIYLPTSAENPNPFSVMHLIPRLRKGYPKLKILAISMLSQPSLIEALVEAGISGYVYKDDYESIQKLADIVEMTARGGHYFSPGAYLPTGKDKTRPKLTPRQMEALSLCASYPDESSEQLARRLQVDSSTFRNLMSGSYKRLGVGNRAAAISKAIQLGLLPPNS